MRNVVWFILLFAFAVLAAAVLGRNDAVVTLYWAPWRMDLSFNFFILALLLLCVGLFVTLQTLYTLRDVQLCLQLPAALQKILDSGY